MRKLKLQTRIKDERIIKGRMSMLIDQGYKSETKFVSDDSPDKES